MAVERDSLEVGDQIFLGRRLGALVGDLPRQLVQLSSGLGDPAGRVDHRHRRLKGPLAYLIKKWLKVKTFLQLTLDISKIGLKAFNT